MAQPSSVLLKIVQTMGDLPTMPSTASLILDKLADPMTTSKELHKIISNDQALAARVLKIANSPFYGCARTITRLTDAINIMGFNSIKSLVMTSVMNDLFKSFGLTEKLLWEHSLGCAAASKKIAQTVRFSRIEESFLAGLMHDLGKVILNLKLREKMMEIVQEVYNQPGTMFAEVEERVFGFNHAAVGELIAKKWNFADEIVEAIGNHHHPAEAKILPPLSHVVCLANSICHKLEIGPTRIPDIDLTKLPSAKYLKLDDGRMDDMVEEIREITSSQSAVSGF